MSFQFLITCLIETNVLICVMAAKRLWYLMSPSVHPILFTEELLYLHKAEINLSTYCPKITGNKNNNSVICFTF